MGEQEYICTCCGEVVKIDQLCFDKYDLDEKCEKCYYEDKQGF